MGTHKFTRTIPLDLNKRKKENDERLRRRIRARIMMASSTMLSGGGANSPAANPYASYALATDFDDQSYWVNGTEYGATEGPQEINSAVRTATASAAADGTVLYQQPTPSLKTNVRYRLTFTVSNFVAGNFNVRLGNNTLNTGGAGITGNGPYSLEFMSSNIATLDLTFVTTGVSSTFDLSDISLKALPGVQQLPGYTFTRTGEQGAVNYLYGTELVTNGDFADATGWSTAGGIWTIGGGVASDNSGAGGVISVVSPETIAVGELVEVTFTLVSRTTGSVLPYIGGTLGTERNAPGTYTEVMTVTTASNQNIGVVSAYSPTGISVDDISIRKITQAVEWFPANVPAINDQGYHAYGELTNLVPDSRPSTWTEFGAVVKGATNKLAPDGTNTAVEVNLPASSANSVQLYKTTDIPAGWVTVGMFVRSRTGGTQKFTLKINAGSDQNSDDKIATPEWQFFRYSWNVATATAGGNVSITNASDASAASLEVWHGQLLAGSFPDGGPLIRTAGATASIGESILYTNGPALTGGDMLMAATAKLGGSGARWFADLSQLGSTANRISLFQDSNNFPHADVIIGGASVYDGAIAVSILDQTATLFMRRLAGVWQLGMYKDGALTWSASSATAAFPTLANKVGVGNYNGGTVPARGIVGDVIIKEGTFSTDAEIIAAIEGTV